MEHLSCAQLLMSNAITIYHQTMSVTALSLLSVLVKQVTSLEVSDCQSVSNFTQRFSLRGSHNASWRNRAQETDCWLDVDYQPFRWPLDLCQSDLSCLQYEGADPMSLKCSHTQWMNKDGRMCSRRAQAAPASISGRNWRGCLRASEIR